jgi:hypothetical protein
MARVGGVLLNGEAAPRVPHILNLSFHDVEGESLITALRSIAVSTGSACHSATGDPSYVLRALGRGTRLAESSLRFSLGRFTTADEVDFAIEEVLREVTRLRAVSPRSAGEGPTAPPDRVDSAHEGPNTNAMTLHSTAPSGLQLRDAGDVERIGEVERAGEVERLFRELPGAGVIPDQAGTVLHGEAGGPTEEVWVRFHLLVDGDSVKDARFEARGCPHTLATAAWLSGELRGRRREQALGSGPQAWAQVLGVPVEKLGRLLVIEDALNASLRSWPS